MKKFTLSILLFVLCAPLSLTAKPAKRHVDIKVEGMTCGMCEKKIQEELSRLCLESSISYKQGMGHCTYLEGEIGPNDILKAVDKAGYQGFIVNATPLK